MCELCNGTGIKVVLIETRAGCGGWFSSDGRVYSEDYQACECA